MICEICRNVIEDPHPTNNRCRCGSIIDANGKKTGGFEIEVRPPDRPRKSPAGLYDNVGNCLAELIPEWAVGSKQGCKCKDIQALLNRWGTSECEERFDWIVQKMKGQKRHLRGALSKIPDSVAECGVRYLVKKAIKMSKKK